MKFVKSTQDGKPLSAQGFMSVLLVALLVVPLGMHMLAQFLG